MHNEYKSVKDLVVRKIIDLGCASALHLAVQIGSDTTAEELIPLLESLVQEGILRHSKDSRDPRCYLSPYETIYELAR